MKFRFSSLARKETDISKLIFQNKMILIILNIFHRIQNTKFCKKQLLSTLKLDHRKDNLQFNTLSKYIKFKILLDKIIGRF